MSHKEELERQLTMYVLQGKKMKSSLIRAELKGMEHAIKFAGRPPKRKVL